MTVETPEGYVRCRYCGRLVPWREVRWEDTGEVTEWTEADASHLPGVLRAETRLRDQVHVGCAHCYEKNHPH
jgi:hypothetical protein